MWSAVIIFKWGSSLFIWLQEAFASILIQFPVFNHISAWLNNLFKVKQQSLAMALFHKPGKPNSATSSSSNALEMPLFSQNNYSKPVHSRSWTLHQVSQSDLNCNCHQRLPFLLFNMHHTHCELSGMSETKDHHNSPQGIYAPWPLSLFL